MTLNDQRVTRELYNTFIRLGLAIPKTQNQFYETIYILGKYGPSSWS
jgi:hypothetical protein